MATTSHPCMLGTHRLGPYRSPPLAGDMQAQCPQVTSASWGHTGMVPISHSSWTGTCWHSPHEPSQARGHTSPVPTAHPGRRDNTNMSPPSHPDGWGHASTVPSATPQLMGTQQPHPSPSHCKKFPWGGSPQGAWDVPSLGQGTAAEGTVVLADTDGAGVLGAAALVDGDREATFAIRAGGDGDKGDGVWDAGRRRLRQDLLDDRCHHHLVIAVPAVGTRGQRWVGADRGRVCVPPATHPGWDVPVELGALHQCVGVPVTDERVAVEAAEALGVVLLLPSHLRADAISPGDPGIRGSHGCTRAKARARLSHGVRWGQSHHQAGDSCRDTSPPP